MTPTLKSPDTRSKFPAETRTSPFVSVRASVPRALPAMTVAPVVAATVKAEPKVREEAALPTTAVTSVALPSVTVSVVPASISKYTRVFVAFTS